jgi:diguanylate cyclase (GGDEF)-like protein
VNRRILLVDDTPAIHEDYRKILGQPDGDAAIENLEEALFGESSEPSAVKFSYESAYQGQEALTKVRESLVQDQPFAMAFVDMRMPPGWDGCETIRQMWCEDPNIQVVICTAYSDSSWEKVLATLDVRDRLLILKKPFDSIEVYQLACALTTKWEMTRQAKDKLAELENLVADRTSEIRGKSAELEAANRQLSEAMCKLAALATTDPLTGLKNRRALEEALSKGYSKAVNEGSPLSLIMFDIDHFKQYNDAFGHIAGDDVLAQVGALMRSQELLGATVARFGGEEFVVVLPGAQLDEAVAVAETLRGAIEAESFAHDKITASFGVASLDDSIGCALSLLSEADRALYVSKERGRNQVTTSEPSLRLAA